MPILSAGEKLGPYEVTEPLGSVGPSLGEGRWQVSKDGGTWPRWRADGKELLFSGSDGQPMTAEVTVSGNAFQPGAPKEFRRLQGRASGRSLPGGKQILAGVGPVQTKPEEPITVVLNWRALLKP